MMNNGDKPASEMTTDNEDLAFPRIETICRPDGEDSPVISSAGLTKREIAAMFAMSGLLANPDKNILSLEADDIAEMSTEHADALLAELEKKS